MKVSELILKCISWKVSASGMSFCFTFKKTDLKHLTVIKQKPKTWGRGNTAHKLAQPRAVPAHLLSTTTHSPCYFCPASQASYSSSIKPALHYHFHLRLQIPKPIPFTAKESRGKSTKYCSAGESAWWRPKTILQGNSLEGGLFLP